MRRLNSSDDKSGTIPLVPTAIASALSGNVLANQQNVGLALGVDMVIVIALVMVGYLMMRLVAAIDWNEHESAIPAFLVIAGVPLTFSISAGIGLGVIGFVAVMVAKGRAREVHPLMYALVPLFLAFYTSGWLSDHVFT